MEQNKKSKLDNSMVCTACSQRLDLTKPEGLRQHPTLKVLLCKRCFSLRTTKDIEVGEDGCDEACQWCALEGDLICCDFCSHAFCKLCIRRNLGRAHLNTLLNSDEDDKWKCYICAPESLETLVATCLEVFKEFGLSPEDTNLQLNMDVENIEEERTGGTDEEVSADDSTELVFLQTPCGDVIAVPADQAKKLMDSNKTGTEVKKSRGRPPTKLQGGNILKEGNGVRDVKTPKGKVMPMTKPIVKARITGQVTGVIKKPAVTGHLTGPKIDEYNVWLVLEKLYASTQSMSFLLGSLKDDLIKADDTDVREKQRQNVSNKLWRALLAFRRSFSEVANSCRLPLMGAGSAATEAKRMRMDEFDSDDDDDDDDEDDDEDDEEEDDEYEDFEDYDEMENMGVISS